MVLVTFAMHAAKVERINPIVGNLHDCINSTNWSRKLGSLPQEAKKSTKLHFPLFDLCCKDH